jgi:hypothetical protein
MICPFPPRALIYHHMPDHKWNSKTKHDLMIEVWESLDCETVGATEIERVSKAVAKRFGEGAVESPAAVARLLADEGAELRHAEILELDVQVREFDRYRAAFRNILKFANFGEAAASIKRLDNLRREYERKKDREGIHLVRETARKGLQRAQMISRNPAVDAQKRAEKAEMAQWFEVWLRQPDLFDDWHDLRLRSKEFRKLFGNSHEKSGGGK